MRKSNRILMIIVSILLALTLMSSCLLSGVFAKYVTKNTAWSTMYFKKFGVTITADVSEAVEARVDPDPDEGALTVQVSNLKMRPGDEFFDAIHFTISGTSDVKLRLRISVNISSGYTAANFTVPVGVGGLEADTSYMPIGFTFTAVNTSGENERTDLLAPWHNVDDGTSTADYNAAKGKIIQALMPRLDDAARDYDGSTYYVRKNISAGKKVTFYPVDSANKAVTAYPIDDFYFGFYWPLTHGDTPEEIAKYDEIGTWMANNIDTTFDVTYTVEVYQYQS